MKSTIREEVKQSIKEEIKTALREEFRYRLSNIETQLTKLATVYADVQAVEEAINYNNKRLDDICQSSLPALTSHVEKVATSLALQTLNMDVHRRKWSLTIQGVKGSVGEAEMDTRSSCVALARQHLGVPNATETDFSACHRLSQKQDACIIVRLKDLNQRNLWLEGAKNLKSHTDKISISPNMPPVLRCLKTELLQKRKNLPIEQKRRSYVKHLRQWPYVELHVPNSPTIRPETKVETIVQSVLSFCPLMSLADWSCDQSRLKYKHHVSPAMPQPNADFVTPSTFNPWLAAWMGPIQLNILMQLCAIY